MWKLLIFIFELENRYIDYRIYLNTLCPQSGAENMSLWRTPTYLKTCSIRAVWNAIENTRTLTFLGRSSGTICVHTDTHLHNGNTFYGESKLCFRSVFNQSVIIKVIPFMSVKWQISHYLVINLCKISEELTILSTNGTQNLPGRTVTEVCKRVSIICEILTLCSWLTFLKI